MISAGTTMGAALVGMTVIASGTVAAQPAPAPREIHAAIGAGELRSTTLFAGFNASLDGPVTLAGTITVPTIRCGRRDTGIGSKIALDRLALGARLDGGELPQAGAVVYSFCLDGEIDFFAAIVGTGRFDELDRRVNAGDRIRVETEDFSSHAAVVVTNLSEGWTETRTDLPDVDARGARIGDRRIFLDGDRIGVPRFGSHRYTDVQLSGRPLGAVESRRYDMTRQDGEVLITTAQLDGGGRDFTLTR